MKHQDFLTVQEVNTFINTQRYITCYSRVFDTLDNRAYYFKSSVIRNYIEAQIIVETKQGYKAI